MSAPLTNDQLSLIITAAVNAATTAIQAAPRARTASVSSAYIATVAVDAAVEAARTRGLVIPDGFLRAMIVAATAAVSETVTSHGANATPNETPAVVIDHVFYPHVFETVRANAPFAVELAFRAIFRAHNIDPEMAWPHRALLWRPDGTVSVNSAPELASPMGQPVLPRLARNYTDFTQLVKSNNRHLANVRTLDVYDDMGRQGCRGVLRSLPKLEMIRFIPERLPFSNRTWDIDVPKAVVFADIPLPPAGSARHWFLPWESLIKVTRQSTVQKIVLNVSFKDDNHSQAAALYHTGSTGLGNYCRADLVPSSPMNVRGRPDAGKERLAALTAAVRGWSQIVHTGGRRDKIHNRCTTVTVVGIDSVDPAIFGLTSRQQASTIIHNWLHVSHIAHNCCRSHSSRIHCGNAVCDIITPVFMSVEVYKRTTTPAAFAAETERL